MRRATTFHSLPSIFLLLLGIVIHFSCTFTSSSTFTPYSYNLKKKNSLELSPKSMKSLISNTIQAVEKAKSTMLQFAQSQSHALSSVGINDCIDMLDDSIDHLNSIIRSSNRIQADSMDSPAGRSTCNRKTNTCSSLSAIFANQEICMQRLEHLYMNHKSYISTEKETLRAAINQLNPLLSQILSTVMAENNAVVEPAASSNGNLNTNSSTDDKQVLNVINVTVALDGSGDYMSIQAAVDAAPSKNHSKFIIYVKQGVYHEYVKIPKSKWNLMMIGDGIDATVITGNRSKRDHFKTFDTATFVVSGCGFMAQDITFENTAGPLGYQAVALLANANNLFFYRCAFRGYQDTLYAKSGLQLFRECKIYGTVDFIFGDAAAVFQECEIIIREPMPKQKITVTAQGRQLECSATGFSFHQCSFIPDHDFNMTTTSTYLGRPWRPYSRVVVMKSQLGSLIDPHGWRPWNTSDYRSLNTLYYGEYMNDGAGSDVLGRVKWPGFHPNMSLNEANKFTIRNFISGAEWLPSTSVTYGLDL